MTFDQLKFSVDFTVVSILFKFNFLVLVIDVYILSLHAGVAARAHERGKLERLCRYIARPAVSTKRLSMTRNGQVHYELKTPWRNGTTHVIFEPLDFISRLAALIPKPRVNLTRFLGVFTPYADVGIPIALLICTYLSQ